jgi:hypothetical protein
MIVTSALSGKWELFWAVKEIVGGIRDADFLIDMIRIAAGGRGFAAFGMKPLNSGGARKDASAIVADDLDKQPGNGFSVA